jgi:hypothetical protein
VRKDCGEGSEVAESGGESKWKYGDSSTKGTRSKAEQVSRAAAECYSMRRWTAG